MTMPWQMLRDAVRGRSPMIRSERPISDAQIQPASIDLTVTGRVHAMKAAALPKAHETVEDLIRRFKRPDYEFDLVPGVSKTLNRGLTYLVPLAEHLELPKEFMAIFSPKSSTGRTDVFVHVVADYCTHYDVVPPGYKGRLYLEITPLSFAIAIQDALSLVQMRIMPADSRRMTDTDIALQHSNNCIVFGKDGKPIPNDDVKIRDRSIYFHVDVSRSIVGFEAKSSGIRDIDLSKENYYDPFEYWIPIPRPKHDSLILEPGKFYLLVTRERIRIPPDICGEIIPHDATSGEIRPHYAGFFDPGFGGERGTPGVLEVRCRDMPFNLEDGQPICRMVFHMTRGRSEQQYTGNYKTFRPSLSKHFKDRFEVWGRDE